MLTLVEIFMAPGASGIGLLTEETMNDTGAQIMTAAEAEAVGFHGIPEDPEGRERRFIVCRRSDAKRIMNVLDSHQQVASYRFHEVGG